MLFTIRDFFIMMFRKAAWPIVVFLTLAFLAFVIVKFGYDIGRLSCHEQQGFFVPRNLDIRGLSQLAGQELVDKAELCAGDADCWERYPLSSTTVSELRALCTPKCPIARSGYYDRQGNEVKIEDVRFNFQEVLERGAR